MCHGRIIPTHTVSPFRDYSDREIESRSLKSRRNRVEDRRHRNLDGTRHNRLAGGEKLRHIGNLGDNLRGRDLRENRLAPTELHLAALVVGQQEPAIAVAAPDAAVRLDEVDAGRKVLRTGKRNHLEETTNRGRGENGLGGGLSGGKDDGGDGHGVGFAFDSGFALPGGRLIPSPDEQILSEFSEDSNCAYCAS